MAISGLVVTLSEHDAAAAALLSLASDPRLTLGERFGRRVALVAETRSAHEDRLLFDDLRGLPGVANVDVAFVHLDALPSANDRPDHDHHVEDQHAHA